MHIADVSLDRFIAVVHSVIWIAEQSLYPRYEHKLRPTTDDLPTATSFAHTSCSLKSV